MHWGWGLHTRAKGLGAGDFTPGPGLEARARTEGLGSEGCMLERTWGHYSGINGILQMSNCLNVISAPIFWS